MTLTKTEKALLTRTPIHGQIHVNGKRECDAAARLADRGLVKKFQDLSGMSHGEYYIHPFTRRPRISKSIFVYGGYIQVA